MKYIMSNAMKKLILIIAAIVLAATTSNLYAQSERLSNEDKQEMKERIEQKLVEFQDYLGMIASAKSSNEIKDKAISSALDMFIGKGKPYQSWDGYNDEPIYNSGVKMQTSSTSGRKRSQLMSSYLARLKGMIGGRYGDIVIEAADGVKVDDIQMTSDGRYISTAYICQRFCGYSESGYKIYEDYTIKKIKIYIDKKDVVTPVGNKVMWIIQLGDMSVIETWY